MMLIVGWVRLIETGAWDHGETARMDNDRCKLVTLFRRQTSLHNECLEGPLIQKASGTRRLSQAAHIRILPLPTGNQGGASIRGGRIPLYGLSPYAHPSPLPHPLISVPYALSGYAAMG
jgi:hypothetical protein